MNQPGRTPEQQALYDKLDKDLQAAATIAARTVKFAVRVAVMPKIELFKKFVRVVLEGKEE